MNRTLLVVTVTVAAGLLGPAGLARASSDADGEGRPGLFQARPGTPASVAAGGIAGVPCGTCQGIIDDGTGDNNIGLTGGGDMVWANQYSTFEGDCEQICAIRVAFGPLAAAGSPVRLFVYDDPNNDGSPADAVILASVVAATENENTDTFNDYELKAPVTVAGVYFLAAAVEHAGSDFPARIDQTASQGRSWIGVPADPNDPLPTGGPVVIDDIGPGFAGNWMIRGIGPEPEELCAEDTNGDLTVDVQDLSAVILAWGTADEAADVTGDGIVDVQDLSAIVLAWGPCPLNNDDCTSSQLVPDGTTNFSTIGATADATAPAFTCGNAVNDVWFRYVASCPLVLTIDTAGSGFDTVLEVFAGFDCPPTEALACDDDTLGAQSQVQLSVNSGEEFLIRVGGWDGDAEGLGLLNIACEQGPYECNATPESPANDCCDAGEGGGGPTVVDGIVGQIDLPFDTTDAQTDGVNDPSNPCSSAADDSQIHKDVWYLYHAPATGFLSVTTCLQATFDSKIAAYSVPGGIVDCDPSALIDTFIACNEDCPDDGGMGGSFTSTLDLDVEAGQSYLVRLGGFSPTALEADAEFGAGTISFILELPSNDFCDFAEEIAAGQSATGNTCDATVDDDLMVECGNGVPLERGRWHLAVGDGTTYTASLCEGAGTAFDSRLTVLCGADGPDQNQCESLACAGIEPIDNCDGDDATFTWCTEAGRPYLILVHADFDCGDYTLTLSSDGQPCDDPPCQPCINANDNPALAQQCADATPEPETCGEDVNGGCNSDPPAFTDAVDGDVFCGTAWADADTRDTDWYRVTLGLNQNTVAANLTAEIDAVVILIPTLDNLCDLDGANTVLGASSDCSSGSAQLTGLVPGQVVYVFVATADATGAAIFDGFPCEAGGDRNQYILEIPVQ